MRRRGKVRFLGIATLALAGAGWLAGPAGHGICRAENLPDPTRPPAAVWQSPEQPSDLSSETWEVTSILVSPGRRVAVINGQSRQEGDKVAGAVVLKISPLAVTFRKDGRDINVGLGGSRIKKPVAASRNEAIGQ